MSGGRALGVVVTLEDIYATVLEINRKLEPLPEMAKDHETRIRGIERRQWLWLGAAGAVGGVLGRIIGGL